VDDVPVDVGVVAVRLEDGARHFVHRVNEAGSRSRITRGRPENKAAKNVEMAISTFELCHDFDQVFPLINKTFLSLSLYNTDVEMS
jgi:hypothetical protein